MVLNKLVAKERAEIITKFVRVSKVTNTFDRKAIVCRVSDIYMCLEAQKTTKLQHIDGRSGRPDTFVSRQAQ